MLLSWRVAWCHSLACCIDIPGMGASGGGGMRNLEKYTQNANIDCGTVCTAPAIGSGSWRSGCELLSASLLIARQRVVCSTTKIHPDRLCTSTNVVATRMLRIPQLVCATAIYCGLLDLRAPRDRPGSPLLSPHHREKWHYSTDTNVSPPTVALTRNHHLLDGGVVDVAEPNDSKPEKQDKNVDRPLQNAFGLSDLRPGACLYNSIKPK